MSNSNESESTPKPTTPATWSWLGVLESAQSQAQDLVAKAQVIAESARKEATTIVHNVEEYAKKYDVDAAKNVILSIGSVATTTTNVPKPPKVHVLDFVYVTENIAAMAFPYDLKKSGPVEDGNDIRVVSRYLNRKHAGHYMIWNISEESYDYTLFDNQVLEYKFPGHPAPPLGLLFKICSSIESWLDADDRNIAIIHCLTGKGRTAALIACVLTWISEFSSPMEALQYVSDRKSIALNYLTIASQRRYVQYFSNMLDGVRPRSEPLLLRRVIMNNIPIFDKMTSTTDPTYTSEGCCPYIQLFKNGRLLATATPPSTDKDTTYNLSAGKKTVKLKWVSAEEGNIPFQIDVALQGDILLRCRHATSEGKRISMFRAAFHTGYVPYGVLRLYKAQLDGANEDDRFADDFFIDLIFAPIETSSQSTLVTDSPTATNSISDGTNTQENTEKQQNELSVCSSSVVGVPSDSGLVLEAVAADKYEQTIHRDNRFWDAIASRKLKAKKRRARKFLSQQEGQFSIADELKSGTLDDYLKDSEITQSSSNDVNSNNYELSFIKSKMISSSSNTNDSTTMSRSTAIEKKTVTDSTSLDQNEFNWAQLSDEELILKLSGESSTSDTTTTTNANKTNLGVHHKESDLTTTTTTNTLSNVPTNASTTVTTTVPTDNKDDNEKKYGMSIHSGDLEWEEDVKEDIHVAQSSSAAEITNTTTTTTTISTASAPTTDKSVVNTVDSIEKESSISSGPAVKKSNKKKGKNQKESNKERSDDEKVTVTSSSSVQHVQPSVVAIDIALDSNILQVSKGSNDIDNMAPSIVSVSDLDTYNSISETSTTIPLNSHTTPPPITADTTTVTDLSNIGIVAANIPSSMPSLLHVDVPISIPATTPTTTTTTTEMSNDSSKLDTGRLNDFLNTLENTAMSLSPTTQTNTATSSSSSLLFKQTDNTTTTNTSDNSINDNTGQSSISGTKGTDSLVAEKTKKEDLDLDDLEELEAFLNSLNASK